jgi:hypothetical protein
MPFDDTQKKEIGDLLGELLAPALEGLKVELTKQVSGVSAKLTKAIEKHAEGAVTKDALDVLLKEKLTATVADPGAGDPVGKPAAGGKPDPAVVKLQEEVDRLKKIAKEAEDSATAIKAETAKREEESALKAALGKKVAPDYIDAVALLLNTRDKAIFRDDEGKIRFRLAKKVNGRTEDVDFDLEDGVVEWAKTDAAKPYLPPTQAKGSNERGQERPGRGGDPLTESRTNFFAGLNKLSGTP